MSGREYFLRAVRFSYVMDMRKRFQMQERDIYAASAGFLCLLLLWGCGESNNQTPTGSSGGELASVQMNPMLSVSSTSACALKANGKPTCKGKASTGLTVGKTYSHIAVSDDTFCGLRTGGTLTSKGSITCNGSKAVQNGKPSGGGFASIFAGRQHFCAVKENNAFVCWGPVCEGENSCWYQESQRDLFARHTQGKPLLGTAWQRVESKGNFNLMDIGGDLTCYSFNEDNLLNEQFQCFGSFKATKAVKGILPGRLLSVWPEGFCIFSELSNTRCYQGSNLQQSENLPGSFGNVLSEFRARNEVLEIAGQMTTDVFARIQVFNDKQACGFLSLPDLMWACDIATDLGKFLGPIFDVAYDASLYCRIQEDLKRVQCRGAVAEQNSSFKDWKL
ncbi:MAG: hypothetical protein AAF320_01740 [Myxococcota bacterium]